MKDKVGASDFGHLHKAIVTSYYTICSRRCLFDGTTILDMHPMRDMFLHVYRKGYIHSESCIGQYGKAASRTSLVGFKGRWDIITLSGRTKTFRVCERFHGAILVVVYKRKAGIM